MQYNKKSFLIELLCMEGIYLFIFYFSIPNMTYIPSVCLILLPH
jgi:hypothetical protein